MMQTTTENLAGLISQRHACLVQLHNVGCKQSELIEAGEMGRLLRLLSAKNQLLTSLQVIERQLAPFHEQAPESRNWSSPESQAQCASQAQQCQSLLEEIMQMERQNEQRMSERRDRISGQLQTVHAAHRARGAYQAQRTSGTKTVAVDMPTAESTAPYPAETEAGGRLDLQSGAS